MAQTIELTKGYVAIVDDEDFERVAAAKWYALVDRRGAYARRDVYEGGRRETVRMHRAIVEAPPRMYVDHINGDRLDNRRCNLRVCTRAENNRNRRRASGRSAFKGVSFRAGEGSWQARIRVDGRLVWLGRFAEERDAAMAYDAAALLHHGEFACTNAMMGLMGEREALSP